MPLILSGVTIGYAKDDTAEISGRRDSLVALARALRSATQMTITVAVPSYPPDPYERWLGSIVVRPRPTFLVEIGVDNGALVAAGGQDALALLADNIAAFANSHGPLGQHQHIEYFPDHYYLREGSLPLVVVAA